jgi:hypothetical protein
MNKFFKTIIIALLLLAAAGLFYFMFFRKHDYNILFKIPKDATSVAIVDCRSLSSKLFLNSIGSDSGLLKHLNKYVPETLKNVSWSSTGLGIPDKIAFFTLEDTLNDKINYHFLLNISNASRFNQFMEELCSKAGLKINKREDLHWLIYTRKKLLVAWNDKQVTGIITTKTVSESLKTLVDILNLQEQQSIMTNSVFVQKLAHKHDIFVFSKRYHYCSVKYLNVLNPEIVSMASYIELNKGKANIETELVTQRGSVLEKMLSAKNIALPVLKTDSAIINLKTNVDPHAFNDLLNKLKIIDFEAAVIPSLTTWNGSLNLVFSGSKNVKSTYISYEYDDDFNKVEVSKDINETMMNIQAVFGQFTAPKILKEGKDTVLFKGGNFLFSKKQGYYLTYNKHFAPLSVTKENFKAKLTIFIDFKRLRAILKETKKETTPFFGRLPVEKSEISIYSGGKIKSTFYFANKNQNVLYSILDSIAL